MTHPYDSGFPRNPDGSPRVDFVYGNMPPQPLDERQNYYSTPDEVGNELSAANLTAGDNSNVVLAEYNAFPSYIPNSGNTLMSDDTPAFIFPLAGPCWTENIQDSQLKDFDKFYKAVGLPNWARQDFTFTGGNGKYDWQGGDPNFDGSVFWWYWAPDEVIYYDPQGVPRYASEFDGYVAYAWANPGQLLTIDSVAADSWYKYVIIVIQTTDPNKDTQGWWNS